MPPTSAPAPVTLNTAPVELYVVVPATPTAPMSWFDQPGGRAGCDAVNVRPAIATVPVRNAPVLADAVTVTVPVSAPDAPAVTVSQLAAEAAVHAHQLPVVTAIVAVSPPTAID